MIDNSELPDIDLISNDLKEVIRILNDCVPEYDVWAFGSRVEGRAKTYSDLDLAIITDGTMSLSKKADLKNAFDESDMTIKVDFIDWSSINEGFRKIIKKRYIPIQHGSEKRDESLLTQ